MLEKRIMYYQLDSMLIANLKISCCKIALVLRAAVNLDLVVHTSSFRTQEAVAGRVQVLS